MLDLITSDAKLKVAAVHTVPLPSFVSHKSCELVVLKVLISSRTVKAIVAVSQRYQLASDVFST